MKGRVLIVAGSDSGGGAGIQADIKTVSAFGAYAATAITAITVQNTLGVENVHFVPPDIIADQIRVVLDDIGADAVKTGMLGTAAAVTATAEALARHGAGVPLVVDPVMISKSGARLLDEDAVAQLKRALLPRAALVTPNFPEAEALTGVAVSGREGAERAGRHLLELGAGAALVTGGHGQSARVDDVLVTRQGMRVFSSSRLDTRHTHGTGCTLASAVAAGLAQGADLEAAVERAIAYVQKAIRTAPGFGAGHGPLNHLHRFGD